MCVGTLHELTGADVFSAIQTSCVIAVTEHATAEVYNVAQYLADVSFGQEDAVVIGVIDLGQFRWKDGTVLSLKDEDDSTIADVLYFPRRVVDRTCLLTPHTMWSHPVARRVRPHGKDAKAWVDFINGACHVYRTADGVLSPAGIHRQYILQNLFFVENVTKVRMGCIYGYEKGGECQRNVTKNDNSSCKPKAAGFYHLSELAVDKFKQCDKREMLSTSYSNNVMHEAEITECSKIELPSFHEFFQNYLQKSKPVIIKNAARSWPAFTKWSNKLLRDLYGDSRVHIKLSPSGDYEGVEPAEIWEDFATFHIPDIVRSQLLYPDLVVVRPATLDMKFSDFLDLVENVSNGIIKNISAYLEYTSLSEYFKELLGDVHEMPFISGLLNLKHQNIWLSDGNTLGKLHFDPFDNFLCQVCFVQAAYDLH